MAYLMKVLAIFAVLASFARCEDAASAASASAASASTAAAASASGAEHEVGMTEKHASSEKMEGMEEGVYDSEEEQEEEPSDEPDKEAEPLSSDQMHTLHGRIDFNRDGKVTLVEIMGFSRQMRKSMAKRSMPGIIGDLDKNSDNKLSLMEMLADMSGQDETPEDKASNEQYRTLETKKFKAADVNNNGVLEEEELPAIFYPDTSEAVLQIETEEAMKQRDTDHDGKLSPKEFFWNEASAAEGEPGQSAEEKEQFAKLDTNGDGSISLEELKHHESGGLHAEMAFEKMIALADKDGDKMVTADELDKARKPIAESDAQNHLMDWRDSEDDEL